MVNVRSRTLGRGAVAVVMALAVATGTVAPAAAGDLVPFKGSLDGSATVTPLDPPFASVVLEGSGTAMQLGRYTLDYSHTVNQATRVGSGTYVFTAANGDTLTAAVTGQATLVAPGELSVAEIGTITGGTGQFAGATGSFVVERTFFLATGITTGSFSGTISSPGA